MSRPVNALAHAGRLLHNRVWEKEFSSAVGHNGTKDVTPRISTVDVLLADNGLSIEDLAERTGLAVDRTTAIVMGRWTPAPAERRCIAKAFGVEIDMVSWGHTMDPRNVRYRQFGMRGDF
ncbi:MAG: helix-turn-helix transcriptional regulator [Planctomycetaceae bacterium]